MSHPTRESFRQFNNLDPQARLEEFHKRFDRLKSEFQNSPRQMFESTNRPFFGHHPTWTGTAHDDAQPANVHVPVEKTIPIQVQHERSRSEPVEGQFNANQSAGNVPNDPRMHFMPENSFFQHKFQSPFANEVAANTSETSAAEPRVHRIPIQVESRNSSTTPMAANSGHMSSQSVPNQANLPNPPQPPHAAATTSTSASNESKPAAARTIEIPIQITKSSSTPETSRKVENSFQGKGTLNPNVNESASDPAIADPNKVYAMGYEPLSNNTNQAEKAANQGAPKKETPFDYVKEVLEDLKNYESQVHDFNGSTPDDKGYRFLDEMLTLCVLRLDCINIDGNDELRKYRKSAINEVNRVAAMLEAKVSKARVAAQQNESQVGGSGVVEQPVLATTTQDESQPKEPIDKKEAKKLEKAKAKKEKEEKEKAKKESGEKKESRRIILFRGKNKNKASQNSANTSSTSEADAMDLDTNNNDLKDGTNQSTSDQNSETASTSSSSTFQGKETAV